MKKHYYVPTQTIQSPLIKYEAPELITSSIERKEQLHLDENPITPPYGEIISKVENPCQDAGLNRKETIELLNTILPPKDWVEGGFHWRQSVSSEPATRPDVVHLEKEFNILLKERIARDTGICSIRRELFSQCLDELIREITVTSAERGLLLLRIRDEYNKAFYASRSLYSSSSAYGMRKALLAESGKFALEKKIIDIAIEKDELEESIRKLDAKMDDVDRGFNEKREADEKRHFEEVQHLKRANNQIKQQLESIVQPPKKTD